MPKGDAPGEFEQIVLLAVLRLGEEAYGMRVRREIHLRTGRDVTIGAVYTTLERLETKGMVESSLGEATEERGGRAKRFFRVTADAVESLNRARAEMNNMLEGLPYPLGGKRG
jgi:PadR family transcriptional regulator, regulatory protein PadR